MSQNSRSSFPMLAAPVEAASALFDRVPGAGVARNLAGGVLDAVGAVSPRARRTAVYAGAGLLGVAGVVEWPFAATVVAAAWLTQPRPRQPRTEPGDGAAARGAAGQAGEQDPGGARPAGGASTASSPAGAVTTRAKRPKSPAGGRD